MADDVQVPINRDNAVLLLAAAQELELDPGVVRTTTHGHFLVSQEVADKAGLGKKKAEPKAAEKKAPAKKAAATKKAAAKAPAKGQE